MPNYGYSTAPAAPSNQQMPDYGFSNSQTQSAASGTAQQQYNEYIVLSDTQGQDKLDAIMTAIKRMESELAQKIDAIVQGISQKDAVIDQTAENVGKIQRDFELWQNMAKDDEVVAEFPLPLTDVDDVEKLDEKLKSDKCFKLLLVCRTKYIYFMRILRY